MASSRERTSLHTPLEWPRGRQSPVERKPCGWEQQAGFNLYSRGQVHWREYWYIKSYFICELDPVFTLAANQGSSIFPPAEVWCSTPLKCKLIIIDINCIYSAISLLKVLHVVPSHSDFVITGRNCFSISFSTFLRKPVVCNYLKFLSVWIWVYRGQDLNL